MRKEMKKSNKVQQVFTMPGYPDIFPWQLSYHWEIINSTKSFTANIGE